MNIKKNKGTYYLTFLQSFGVLRKTAQNHALTDGNRLDFRLSMCSSHQTEINNFIF